LGVCLVVSFAAEAWAQSRSTLSTGSEFGYNPEMQRVMSSTRVRPAPSVASSSRYARGLSARALSINPGGGQQRGSKPFANVQRQPTLSPYLNLLRNDGDDMGGLPNYHTFVRPMLDQQQTNRRTNKRIQGLGQEVQAVNRQLAQQPTGASELRPTGHQTVFMNHSHYYTFAGRRR
jgi:hypothetical protein